MSESFRAAIEEIARDSSSGAAEILRRAAEVFSLIAVAGRSDDEARRIVLETCALLIRAQPCMASVANLASHVAEAVSLRRGETSPTARDPIASAQESARHFVERAESAVEKVSQIAAELIKEGARILTHSRSSTVLAALVRARRLGKGFRVIATESRPLVEGRTLAAELAREGTGVTLIADAAAASVIDSIDLVMVGADRVTPREVVNKIGTRMIALAAQEKGVPVYALADTTKFISVSVDSGDLGPGDELWEDAPARVDIMNRYFESVPLMLFADIITEDGLLAPGEASLRAGNLLLHFALSDVLGEQTREISRPH